MNHQTVDEEQIAERYLQGKLLPEEEASFEEHYLSCPECLDRLALAESMRRGFKRAAGQEAARQAAARQLALVAWLARLGRSRQVAALATTIAVFVLVPVGLTLRERGARVRLEEQLASALEPQGNVPILFLDAERGGGEPSHRLRLPAAPGWIVLALAIDPPYQPLYRVVVHDGRGQEIWRGTGLRLNEMETLSLSLHSTLLAPGDYDLSVEGLDEGGQAVPGARYAFRVVPAATSG